MIEWGLGVLAVFIGAILGNMFALGRDLRKERNEARYPLWKWFNSNPPGEGHRLPSASSVPGKPGHVNELSRYQSVISSKEWREYEAHIKAIRTIRQPYQFNGEYDPAIGSHTRDRAPTQEELDSVSKHWEGIKHLLRHRLLL